MKSFPSAESTSSFDEISSIIQKFLTGQTSRVQAVAGPNATSYSLLAPAMEHLSLTVDMPPYTEKLIPSLKFQSMSLIPSTDNKIVSLSASIIIEINSPLGLKSPLDIQKINMTASLKYSDDTVGTLTITNAIVEQIDPINYLTVFSNIPLLLSGTGRAYEYFAQNFISANYQNQIIFSIIGLADIQGSFALGPLNIAGIDVNNAVFLTGLDGLQNVCVHGISIDGEDHQSLLISINVSIVNPGITVVQLRRFTLLMIDESSSVQLGKIPVDVLLLEPGRNEMMLYGFVFFDLTRLDTRKSFM